MRCSSCEPLLDRFLEGTLPSGQHADIAAHLRGCDGCARLLEEVKIVDALLVTRQVPELPANFTFAVMAEVRAMPAPKTREPRIWSFFALYLTAAWVAAGAGLALAGFTPGRVATAILTALERAGSAVSAGLAGIGHGAPALAALGTGLLLIDLVAAAVVVLLYVFIRPRLAAQLASASEER